MEELNKYHIRLNSKNRIIHCFSDLLEQPLQTDIKIGEGSGSQFRVSIEKLSVELQKYADIENGLPLTNEQGIFILKFEDGLIKKVSEEEIKDEIDWLSKVKPTEIEVLKARLDYIAMMSDINLEV